MNFAIKHIRWMSYEVQRQKASAIHVTGFAMAVELIYELERKDFTVDNMFAMNQLVTMGDVRYGYRQTPVTFQNGGGSCSPGAVSDAMNSLFSALLWIDNKDVDSWIKDWLWIHPFEDGNGRTASILRNWMLGTLDSPTDLPDYGW